MVILDEQNLTSEERSQEQKAVLDRARQFYNPRRPWEIYVEIDDGEYLTNKGVKVIVKCGRIINLIPRHLQTTTTFYPDSPTPEEMNGMLKLNCYG